MRPIRIEPGSSSWREIKRPLCSNLKIVCEVKKDKVFTYCILLLFKQTKHYNITQGHWKRHKIKVDKESFHFWV